MKIIKPIHYDQGEKAQAILTHPARQIKFPLCKMTLEMIEEVKKSLLSLKGAGLAAVQLGIPYQVMLLAVNNQINQSKKFCGDKLPLSIYINPSYEPINSKDYDYEWEGCYSLPSFYAKIKRFTNIWARYHTVEGIYVERKLSHFYARIFQHATDHCHGILINDHCSE